MATNGTSGNDFLEGTADEDTLLGLEGDDVLIGLDNDDLLNGNQNTDRIFGGLGNDTLYGGQGDDLVFGGIDDDQLFGDRGNDTVLGEFNNDSVFGGLGNDFVNGNAGNDTVFGEEGDDRVYGGQNSDTLFGGAGNDFVSGDLGSDLLYGDQDTDTLDGGPGKDIFVLQKKFAADRTAEGDIIRDFTNGEDLMGLEPDLTFGELRIFGLVQSEFSKQTTIADKNTGRVLAVLSGIDSSTIDETDFTTTLQPEGDDLPGGTFDSPPTFNFGSPTYSVRESPGAGITLTVLRQGSLNGIVTVDYSTADGTARAGSDYEFSDGSFTFNPGETSKTFLIPINNDFIQEGQETFNVVLSQPLGGATLGSQSTATVAIEEDETPPQVLFPQQGYTVNENTRIATIPIQLSGVTQSPVTVTYSTSEGTAKAGEDYEERTATVTFLPGETTKTFTVLINNDTVAEGDENIRLTLSDATGGDATVRDPSTVLLNIVDDETSVRLNQSVALPNNRLQGSNINSSAAKVIDPVTAGGAIAALETSGMAPSSNTFLTEAQFRSKEITFENLLAAGSGNLKFDVAKSGGIADLALPGSSLELPPFQNPQFPLG